MTFNVKKQWFKFTLLLDVLNCFKYICRSTVKLGALPSASTSSVLRQLSITPAQLLTHTLHLTVTCELYLNSFDFGQKFASKQGYGSISNFFINWWVAANSYNHRICNKPKQEYRHRSCYKQTNWSQSKVPDPEVGSPIEMNCIPSVYEVGLFILHIFHLLSLFVLYVGKCVVVLYDLFCWNEKCMWFRLYILRNQIIKKTKQNSTRTRL